MSNVPKILFITIRKLTGKKISKLYLLQKWQQHVFTDVEEMPELKINIQ